MKNVDSIMVGISVKEVRNVLSTLTQKMRERGRVARQSSTDTSASSSAMQPGPSASPE